MSKNKKRNPAEVLGEMRDAKRGKAVGSIWEGGTIKYERGGFTDEIAKFKGPQWTDEGATLKANFDARVIPGSIEPVENIIEEK